MINRMTQWRLLSSLLLLSLLFTCKDSGSLSPKETANGDAAKTAAHDGSQSKDEPVILEKGTKLIVAVKGKHMVEVSGIDRSLKQSGMFWMINDSGNAPSLYALDTITGNTREIKVKGAVNRDWEDLVSLQFEGKPHLLIADTGDNKSIYKTVKLYLVPEPDLTRHDDASEIEPTGVIEFQYEDGPRDCEAIAYDPSSEQILLLSKRTVPPVLYALPLSGWDAGGVLTAKRLGEATGIPKPEKMLKTLFPDTWEQSAQPTAMDISDDGSTLVILTYYKTWMFKRSSEQTWVEVLAQKPFKRVSTPLLKQAESMCFGNDETAIYVISEKKPDLYKTNLPLTPAPD